MDGTPITDNMIEGILSKEQLPIIALGEETSKELAKQTAKQTSEQFLANAKNLATDAAGGFVLGVGIQYGLSTAGTAWRCARGQNETMKRCNKRCKQRLRGKNGVKKVRAVLSNVAETTSVFVVEAYNEAPPKGEVAASTAGGMAGAKLGACTGAYIGAFGGPPGVAVGGVIGGVVGAIGGGWVTKWVAKKLFGW